jgi:hypothetical protein
MSLPALRRLSIGGFSERTFPLGEVIQRFFEVLQRFFRTGSQRRMPKRFKGLSARGDLEFPLD